jgi:hypothetical protein
MHAIVSIAVIVHLSDPHQYQCQQQERSVVRQAKASAVLQLPMTPLNCLNIYICAIEIPH